MGINGLCMGYVGCYVWQDGNSWNTSHVAICGNMWQRLWQRSASKSLEVRRCIATIQTDWPEKDLHVWILQWRWHPHWGYWGWRCSADLKPKAATNCSASATCKPERQWCKRALLRKLRTPIRLVNYINHHCPYKIAIPNSSVCYGPPKQCIAPLLEINCPMPPLPETNVTMCILHCERKRRPKHSSPEIELYSL